MDYEILAESADSMIFRTLLGVIAETPMNPIQTLVDSWQI